VHPWRMPAIVEGVLLIVIVATIAAVLGLGFGRVVAPRIGRALDRADADSGDDPADADEEPG
jgi:Na+/H+-dicarboxylate symporter